MGGAAGRWVFAAALIGALVGTDAYDVGVPGQLTGPILIAAVVIALQTMPNLSSRGRRRALALTGVAASSAVLVGLTIFL